MSSPKLRTEAAAAGNYPEKRFNQRERKLLQSVSNAVKAGTALTDNGGAQQTIYAAGVNYTDVAVASVTTPTVSKIIRVTALIGAIEVEFDTDPGVDVGVSWIAVQTQ